MVQGITYSKEVQESIIADYKANNSIYGAAKRNKVHYNTANKYIKQSGIDSRTLLPQLKSQAPGISPIYNIYNKEDIRREDIKSKEDIKYNTDKTLSHNNSIQDKSQYYISSLNTILSRMLKRYKAELKDIDINKMYLHYGTLHDKLNTLLNKDKAGPDSQVIMNFYGDDSKVKGLISKIKDSKGKL